MSPRWSNWSGRVTARPAEIVQPGDEPAVVEALRRATREGRRVRAVGAAHSHVPLAATEELLVDPSRLRGVVKVDAARREAVVRAGTRISALGPPLHAAGVALHNQGDIDRQAIGGAVATGTHGTGIALRNLSAGVTGARVVLADSELIECDAEREPELFHAVRLSLGAVGVVTELHLSVRDAYKLEERMWGEDLDAVLERIDELAAATRHFEFFWLPGRARAACKSLAETDAEPCYPLADEGQRLAWSYEVLANDRPDKHTEMEYSLPAASGPACVRALRELIARDFPDLAWPLEYRTLAADDVWLSTAYERPTVTISVHQGIDRDDGELFRACESVFRGFEGRPHWGKVHFRSGRELADLHPRWDEWWRVRDRVDPDGRFLNDYLRALRG